MTGRLLARLALLLVAVAAVVPSSGQQPTVVSLVAVEQVKAVDAGDGVVWVLVLGSDAPAQAAPASGLTDLVQLLGINPERGSASAIGIPRDTLVDYGDGDRGRINGALREGREPLVAQVVADLVGITPDYVLTVGAEGFTEAMGLLGDVDVRASEAFVTDDEGMQVRRGVNTFDAAEALEFARTRRDLSNFDFTRVENHQALLLGMLRRVRAREDEEGFLEQLTLAGLRGLDTGAAPTDLYRLAQAVTLVRPDRVTGCVVLGRFVTIEGASYVEPFGALARRLGEDAAEDAELEPGCRG